MLGRISGLYSTERNVELIFEMTDLNSASILVNLLCVMGLP